MWHKWLRLERVIERLLQLFDALKSYFVSTDLKASKTKRPKQLFSDPLTKVYLLFLHAFLPTLTTPNRILQQSAPQAHSLKHLCEEPVHSVLRKFCANSAEINEIRDLSELPCLEDHVVKIGLATKQKLNQLVSSGEVSAHGKSKFYQNAISYMEAVASYLLSNLPLLYDFLNCIRWVNPMNLPNCSSEEMMEGATRFRKIFKYTDGQLDELEDRFDALKCNPEFLQLFNY